MWRRSRNGYPCRRVRCASSGRIADGLRRDRGRATTGLAAGPRRVSRPGCDRAVFGPCSARRPGSRAARIRASPGRARGESGRGPGRPPSGRFQGGLRGGSRGGSRVDFGVGPGVGPGRAWGRVRGERAPPSVHGRVGGRVRGRVCGRGRGRRQSGARPDPGGGRGRTRDGSVPSGLRERAHTSTSRPASPRCVNALSSKRSSPAPICMQRNHLDMETPFWPAATRRNVTSGDRADASRAKITAPPAS